MNRFAAFPASAVFDKRLSPRDLTVLAAIGVHADKHGWCHPSLSRLGEMLGVTRQAVQKSVRVLVACNYVEARARFRSDGGQSSNKIRVLFDVEQPMEEMREPERRADAPPATPEVAPPATPEVAPPATPEVAPPATPEVAQNTPLNTPLNTKREKRASAPRSSSGEPVDCPADVRPEIWRDWLALRKRKRAEVTPTVIAAARHEAEKAGMTMDAFLTEWCLRGSQGLKADWLKPNERNNGGNPNGSRRESVAGRIARINAEAASRGHDIDGEYRRLG